MSLTAIGSPAAGPGIAQSAMSERAFGRDSTAVGDFREGRHCRTGRALMCDRHSCRQRGMHNRLAGVDRHAAPEHPQFLQFLALLGNRVRL